MPSDYHERLFAAYPAHLAGLDPDEATKLAWFRTYADANYLPHLGHLDRETAETLEVGCSGGYLLATLTRSGFRRLHGIDRSPADVEAARRRAPGAALACADALPFLAAHAAAFDCILLKAVLEHVPKDGVLPLLDAIRQALRPGGTVVVDVPNMAWLFASHERYMDFTHCVGFTRESLRQVMGTAFTALEVRPSADAPPEGVRRRCQWRLARAVLGRLLVWADPEGGSNPIWSRSLIAVGRVPAPR